jgi:hypothetical protein
VYSVRLGNLLQYSFVRLVQRFGQLPKNTPHTWGKTATQSLKLTRNPAKPVGKHEKLVLGYNSALTFRLPGPRASQLPIPYLRPAISSSFCPNKQPSGRNQ